MYWWWGNKSGVAWNAVWCGLAGKEVGWGEMIRYGMGCGETEYIGMGYDGMGRRRTDRMVYQAIGQHGMGWDAIVGKD